jgi:hypothetical protein
MSDFWQRFEMFGDLANTLFRKLGPKAQSVQHIFKDMFYGTEGKSAIHLERTGGAGLRVYSGRVKADLPIAGDIPGVFNIGGSIYSMPGLVAEETRQGIKTTTLEEYYWRGIKKAGSKTRSLYSAMGIYKGETGALGEITTLSMGEQTREQLAKSRSVLTSVLGPDLTLAFHRSKMVDINRLKVTAGGGEFGQYKATIGEHLSNLRTLIGQMNRSGPINLTENQQAVEEYYRSLVGAVEGTGFSLANVKADKFIKGGIASTLIGQDVGFGMGISSMEKGLQRFSKLLPIPVSLLQKYGLSIPTTTGRAIREESATVTRLAQMWGISEPLTSRFGVSYGAILGEISDDTIKHVNLLGDSMAIGGRRIGQLYGRELHRRIRGVKFASAEISLAGLKTAAVAQPAINPKLIPYVEQLMAGQVPKGTTLTKSGYYMFKRPKIIRAEGSRVWLGSHIPAYGVPTHPEDIARSRVDIATGGSRLRVLGFKATKGGGVKFAYVDPEDAMLKGGPREMGIVLEGGKGAAFRVRSTKHKIMLQGLHQGTRMPKELDLLLRAEDIGVRLTEGGFLAEERFIAGNLLPAFAELSRRRGTLSQFAKLPGLAHLSAEGYFPEQIVGTADEAFIGRNLGNTIKKIIASPEKYGLTKEDVASLVTEKEGQIFLSKDLVGRVRYGKKELSVLSLPGVIGAGLRTGQPTRPVTGRGALRTRLHDIVPLLGQMAGIHTGPARESYEGIRGILLGKILKGKGAGVGGLHMGKELAAAVSAVVPPGARPSGYFSGIKLESVNRLTLRQYHKQFSGIKGVKSAQELMRLLKAQGGALSYEQLEGTIHAIGEKPFTGAFVDIGADPVVGRIYPLGESPLFSTRSLYVGSGTFYGAGPSSEGIYFGTRGGIAGKGLPFKKLLFDVLAREELSRHLAGGGTYETFKLSQKSMRLATQMAVAPLWFGPGKQGFVKQLEYRPEGAQRSIVSSLETLDPRRFGQPSVENIYTAAVSKKTFRRMLETGGWEAPIGGWSDETMAQIERGGVYSTTLRYPIHAGENIPTVRMIMHPGAVDDSVYLHSEMVSRFMKGDFDQDAVARMTMRSHQAYSKSMYKANIALAHHYNIYRTKFLEREYAGLRSKGIAEIAGAIGVEISDTTDVRKSIIDALSQRPRGAAGGGVFVGAIDIFSRTRFTATRDYLSQYGAGFAKTMSVFNPDLSERVLQHIVKDPSAGVLLGQLQEAGIYQGSLKKGTSGIFGTDTQSFFESLSEYHSAVRNYGRNAAQREAANVRNVLSEALSRAHAAKNLEIRPAMMEALRASGLAITTKDTSKTIGQKITDRILEAVLTIEETQATLAEKNIQTPLMAFMSGFPHEYGESGQAKRISSIVQLIFGTDIQAAEAGTRTTGAQESAMESLVRINRAAATAPGKPVLSKGPLAQGISALAQSNWGKYAIIGGGILAGIGAADALFGIFGGEKGEPAPPTVIGPEGSPLPPESMAGYMPDAEMVTPNIPRYRNNHSAAARIERPMATRQLYNINGSSQMDESFIPLMSTYRGNSDISPTSSSRIIENRKRTVSDTEAMYLIRSSLNRSF